MKKSITTMAILLFAIIAFAQKKSSKEIPVAVKSAFQKKYPVATAVKWDKEEENYEASFKMNGTANAVVLDAHGNIKETEMEITVARLPEAVLVYIKKHYPGKKVKEAATITDEKGTLTYEAAIKGMDLIFDSNGNFIKELKD